MVRLDFGRGEMCLILLYGVRIFIVFLLLDVIVIYIFVFYCIFRCYLWVDCGEIDVIL